MKLFTAVLACLLLLAACGKKAPLKSPPTPNDPLPERERPAG